MVVRISSSYRCEMVMYQNHAKQRAAGKVREMDDDSKTTTTAHL